jgi:hypothetical protein
LAHSMWARGWMAAYAGPVSAIINAMTTATVTIKTMRLISATSFLRKARMEPSIIILRTVGLTGLNPTPRTLTPTSENAVPAKFREHIF